MSSKIGIAEAIIKTGIESNIENFADPTLQKLNNLAPV